MVKSYKLALHLGWFLWFVLPNALGAAELEISELMAGNVTCCTDAQGDYEDWVEIHNVSDHAIDVAGMGLTDDWSRPTQWQFPTNKPDLTLLEPNDFLIVWADNDLNDSGLHAGFKLSLSGEQIGLFSPDGRTLIDGFTFEPQVEDLSFGRDPESGQLRFFAHPTPGARNNPAYLGQVAAPQFGVERGEYDSSQVVSLSCATSGAVIRYTTDGRDPVQRTMFGSWINGYTYVWPLTVNQTRCLRAMATLPGWQPSPIITQTYLIGLDASLKDLPVISLVGDEQNTFFEPNGVMAIVGGQYTGDGTWTATSEDDINLALVRGLERPVSFEWIEPNGAGDVQIDAGLSVAGSDAMRSHYQRGTPPWQGPAKFSLRLNFRADYGSATLDYPLFATDVHTFDGLVLRGGDHDRENPFVKDELMRRLFRDMGQLSGSGTFAHLFINGEYMGYFNPCEEVNEVFAQQWTESDQSFDIMTRAGLRRGSATDWQDLMQWIGQQDFSDDQAYDQLQQRFDIESWVDALILLLWSGDNDWTQQDWVAFHPSGDTGPWTFLPWDTDAGFVGDPQANIDFTPLADSSHLFGLLYQALLPQPQFKRLFGDRLFKHTRAGGALAPDRVISRFQAMQDELAMVIPDMNTAIEDWVQERIDPLTTACADQGLYTFAGPNLVVNDGIVDILNTAGEGEIYYSLDGSDPRSGDVGVQHYTGPLSLDHTQRVRAVILKQGIWSAAVDEIVPVGSVADALRMTEIMPQPVDPNAEYIELTNIGSTVLHLNYVRLTGGVEFTFPDVTLWPGAFGLVVKDPQAFTASYGSNALIWGTYQGHLADEGEPLELRDAAGATILSLSTYPSWQGLTDANGYSLTLRREDWQDAEAVQNASAWRPSARPGGSPGWDDSGDIPLFPDVRINEILAHSHDEASDWVELYNNDDVVVDLGGWFLSDRIDNPFKYEVPVGTFVPPGGYQVFWERGQFGDPNSPDTREPFALTENGETLYVCSGREGLLTGLVLQQTVGPSQTGVSFGYYKTSTGVVDFPPMAEVTPGWANSAPRVGPIVISEIMYHPAADADAEYVELTNITDMWVTFYDFEVDLPWRFTDNPDNPGIDFRFPTNNVVSLGPGESLILTRDETALAQRFSIPADTQVFTWNSGKLSNSRETLELYRPGDVDDLGHRYWIQVDRVSYSDGTHNSDFPTGLDPWPRSADGNGQSLQRVALDGYANDPANWSAAIPTPGQTSNP